MCHVPAATSAERKKAVWCVGYSTAIITSSKANTDREGGEASSTEVEAMLYFSVAFLINVIC